MSYFVAFLCFTVGAGAFGVATFKYGYNLGWDERHKDMILPRNIVNRVGNEIDTRGDRHSALDPKGPVWH